MNQVREELTPTINPHGTNEVLVPGDMTGCFISHDRGRSWRMFNLDGAVRFFLFDPVDPTKIYIATYGGGVWHTPAEGDSNAPEDVVATATTPRR